MTNDDPDNLVLRLLRDMRAEMGARFDAIDARFDRIDSRIGSIEARLVRIEGAVEELAVAVATLTVSNRQIRADVSKILANQEHHEARIARIEKHLGLVE